MESQTAHARVRRSKTPGGGLLLRMSRWARVVAIWLLVRSKAAKAMVMMIAFETVLKGEDTEMLLYYRTLEVRREKML